MADPPPYDADDTRDDPGVERDLEAAGGTPRWQKVVGIAGLIVVVWVGSEVYENVTGDFGGGGGPGPGQHAPVENQDQEPETDDGGGHRPPTGGHG